MRPTGRDTPRPQPLTEVPTIRIAATKHLFAWDCLEDSHTLKTIQQLIEVIPDEALLESLRTARGKGRNDVPVRVAWGVVVLNIALRHTTIEACLAELRGNESLRRILGIESEDTVRQKWNLSRFLDTLGQEPHLSRLHEVFDVNSNIVYDEAGTVYCYDRESSSMVRHKMAYIGYEPQRETLKYRCPALHEGWSCPMSKI